MHEKKSIAKGMTRGNKVVLNKSLLDYNNKAYEKSDLSSCYSSFGLKPVLQYIKYLCIEVQHVKEIIPFTCFCKRVDIQYHQSAR